MENPSGGFFESLLPTAETGGYVAGGDRSVLLPENVMNYDSQLGGTDSNFGNLGISGGPELPFFMEPATDYFYPFAGIGNSDSQYDIDGLGLNFRNLAISGEPRFRASPAEYSNPAGNSYLQNMMRNAARNPFSAEFTASTSGNSNPAGNSYLLNMMRTAGRDPFSGRLRVSSVPTPMIPSSSSGFRTDEILGSDFLGRILDIAREKEGCKMIQRILELRNPVQNQAIFDRIKPHIPGLIIDPCGNFLIQKCCQVFDHNQFTELLFILIDNETLLKNICNDVHGTRAVQKMVEYMITPYQRVNFLYALRRIVSDIARNQHGNHVIDQCLKLFSSAELTHILKAIADHFLAIAMNRSGCRLVQRCYLRAEEHTLNRLLAETTSNAFILSQHDYGNYVVQFVLEGGVRSSSPSAIVGALMGRFSSLSMNKFSSNVVEKCLKVADEHQRRQIVNELINGPDFPNLLVDPFGNYVIQSAIRTSTGGMRQLLVKRILAMSSMINGDMYGKRVLACVKQFR